MKRKINLNKHSKILMLILHSVGCNTYKSSIGPLISITTIYDAHYALELGVSDCEFPSIVCMIKLFRQHLDERAV